MTTMKQVFVVRPRRSRSPAWSASPRRSRITRRRRSTTTRVVKIEGTITQFRWINPHASIKIDGDVRRRRARRRLDRRDDGAERADQPGLDAHGAQGRRQGHDVREPAAQQSRAERRQHGRALRRRRSRRTARRSATPTAKAQARAASRGSPCELPHCDAASCAHCTSLAASALKRRCSARHASD